MIEWKVTENGYRVLEDTGLKQKIESMYRPMTEKIYENQRLFLDEEEFLDCVDETPRRERRDAMKKFWEDGHRSFDSIFTLSGALTDMVLDEREIQRRGVDYGIWNISDLDMLIGAYVFELNSIRLGRDPYVWRGGGLMTQIYGDVHGDLQFNQEKKRIVLEQTDLDGSFIEPLTGKLGGGHVDASYEFWPVLAATAIKYADTIGVKIPEAENWRDYMKSLGWDGSIEEPGNVGVGYEHFASDYEGDVIARIPDIMDSSKANAPLFGLMAPNANHETNYLPVIDEKEDLLFCITYPNVKGDTIIINRCGLPNAYLPVVKIPKSDAAHLFKGSVYGMMHHQSRTRPEFLAHMLSQYDQLKEGKSSDEIMFGKEFVLRHGNIFSKK